MTFRSLPLTPEQDEEIQRYIAYCKERNLPWDTLELDYMLKDMLREHQEREVGARIPQVLALLAVEKQSLQELDGGHVVPSTTLRNLAEAAGIDRLASLEEMADEATRIKNNLLDAAIR